MRMKKMSEAEGEDGDDGEEDKKKRGWRSRRGRNWKIKKMLRKGKLKKKKLHQSSHFNLKRLFFSAEEGGGLGPDLPGNGLK